MAADLSGVSLTYVDDVESAARLMTWLGERRPSETLGVDLETGEFPGNPKDGALSPWHGRIRLAQIGDGMNGWAIPWERWGGVFQEAMTKFEGRFLIHNAAFDTKWLELHSDLEVPWHKIDDSMIAARICNPTEPAGLKQLTAKHVDGMAKYLQQQLNIKMTDNGWTWGTVPLDLPEYHLYGALDPVLACRMWEDYQPLVGSGGIYSGPYELEMGVLRVAVKMELNGARVDVDYSKEQYDALMTYSRSVRDWAKDAYDLNLGSPKQLSAWFESMGVEITERTKGGAPKVDKVQLDIIAREHEGLAAGELAVQILAMRQAEKLGSSYFKNFIEMNVDGIVHPSINTLAARTGRMCIPTDHMLLTQGGPKKVDDIKIGDLTLDMNGDWVPVQAIHKYDAQEVVAWSDDLVSTREHRWVWNHEGRNKIHVEPTSVGRRHELILAPTNVEPFDFTSKTLTTTTDAEKFAALVGMLVTDGRCVEGGKGVGLRSYIYQTEGKFYDELISNIPAEAVMYDTSRPTPNGTGTVHEIRIKTRYLRPRLSDAGIRVVTSLKDSEDLVNWVSSIPLNELRAFFQAAFLCDGTTAVSQHKIIACQTSNLRTVFQIAGYRLGYVSKVFECAPSEWSNGVRYSVRFRKAKFGLRNRDETLSTSDVWCVSTSSGTFTAWSSGPYLTGNSINNPALQTLPKSNKIVRKAFLPRDIDNEIIMSCDLEQVEARVFSVLSKDTGLIELFNFCDTSDADFFTEIGKQVYSEPHMEKSDVRRQLLKNMMYGRLYGAGISKMAQTAKVPEPQMKAVNDSFDRMFPGMKKMMKEVEALGMRRLREEGEGYVLTKGGRRLPAESDRLYALVNFLIQGTSAEILKQNIMKLDAAGLTNMLIAPVHDEVVLSVPKVDQKEIAMVVQECMTTRDGWEVPLLAGLPDVGERWGELEPIVM